MFLYNIRVRKLESDNCVTCSGNVALVSLHLGGVHCRSFYWTLVIHLCSGAVCENGVLRTMTATYFSYQHTLVIIRHCSSVFSGIQTNRCLADFSLMVTM